MLTAKGRAAITDGMYAGCLWITLWTENVKQNKLKEIFHQHPSRKPPTPYILWGKYIDVLEKEK